MAINPESLVLTALAGSQDGKSGTSPAIREALAQRGVLLSLSQVRRILARLRKRGLLTTHPGAHGLIVYALAPTAYARVADHRRVVADVSVPGPELAP